MRVFAGAFVLLSATCYTATASDSSSFNAPPLLLSTQKAPRFWVVNFGTAQTLAPGKFGFAAGLGGQMVFLGAPRVTNAFFMIPHAGFRYGITPRFDAGIRMAPVPLPFASAGPGFGMNLDGKWCLTKPGKKIAWAVDAGIGASHVKLLGNDRFAWSANAALLQTTNLGVKTALTLMGRYVNIQIPTATGGAADNYVNISGISAGLKQVIAPNITLLPEVGVYWYDGKLTGSVQSGPGFQYGIMLATSF